MFFPLNPAFIRYFQTTSDNHVYHCPIIFPIKSHGQFLCPTKSHQSFMEYCSLPHRAGRQCAGNSEMRLESARRISGE